MPRSVHLAKLCLDDLAFRSVRLAFQRPCKRVSPPQPFDPFDLVDASRQSASKPKAELGQPQHLWALSLGHGVFRRERLCLRLGFAVKRLHRHVDTSASRRWHLSRARDSFHIDAVTAAAAAVHPRLRCGPCVFFEGGARRHRMHVLVARVSKAAHVCLARRVAPSLLWRLLLHNNTVRARDCCGCGL